MHGFRLDDEGTTAEIRRLHAAGYLADPHTAIGVAGGRAHACAAPMICVATAHPAKFPDAMQQAICARPALPPHLATLYDRIEAYTTAPNDLSTIQARVRAFVNRNVV